MRKLRVVLLAPFYSKTVPGESWSTYKWVQGISEYCHTTVLTTHHKDWKIDDSPTDAKEVVNWTDPKLPRRFQRIGWELKPTYPFFYWRARRWLKKEIKAGRQIDLIHQINPLALRYPCPAVGLGVPFIIGPLAGSVPTPQGFAQEETDKTWYRKLRKLDLFRLKHDPWLKKSYTQAEVVIGVAPYVKDLLSISGFKRFEIMSETGVESVASTPKEPPKPGEPLKLLFVGRVIRTKGVIDAIRAVAIASKQCNLRFDIIGEGDMLQACKLEAAKLGLNEIVHFHGRQSREYVAQAYANAHVFLFPSFREPSGNVVFEAMSAGLPVIAATTGGPGYVVASNCGSNTEPVSVDQFAHDLAGSISFWSANPANIKRASEAALKRIKELAHWPNKVNCLVKVYSGAAVFRN